MTAGMSKYTNNSPLPSPFKDTATSECTTRTAIPPKHREGTDLQTNSHGTLCPQTLDSYSPSLFAELPSPPGVLIPTHEQVQHSLVPRANKSHLESSGGQGGWEPGLEGQTGCHYFPLGFRDSEESKTMAWHELQLQGHEDTWTNPHYLTQAATLN